MFLKHHLVAQGGEKVNDNLILHYYFAFFKNLSRTLFVARRIWQKIGGCTVFNNLIYFCLNFVLSVRKLRAFVYHYII